MSFKLSVRLPNPMLPYSGAHETPKKVELYGDWWVETETGLRGDGGEVDPFPVYVRIKPYYYMQVLTDPPLLQMYPGQTQEMDVIIKNLGNSDDRYEVTIPHEGRLARAGWIFEMNRSTLEIPPLSDGRVHITVTSPREVTGLFHIGITSFIIHAESFNTRELASTQELANTMEYDTDVMVSVIGVDFVHIPFMWALVIYLVLMIVAFNLGFNLVTLKRRTWSLPDGRKAGLVSVAKGIGSIVLSRKGRTQAPKDRGPPKARAAPDLDRSKRGPGMVPWKAREKAMTVQLKRRDTPHGKDLDLSELDLGPGPKGKPAKGMPRPSFMRPQRSEKTTPSPSRRLDEVLEEL